MMNTVTTKTFQDKLSIIKNLLRKISIDEIQQEILQGLKAKEKFIPSKYFYDDAGSELFYKITQLPEYYPTRTEKMILENIAPSIMNRTGSLEIMELGSGDCSKISILFNSVEKQHLKNMEYIPVDVSITAIEHSAGELSRIFPRLKISGYAADFMQQLELIPQNGKPRLICFFGSTIGNFTTPQAEKILKNLAANLRENDVLLVGFDLIKKTELLHAAYNDSQGVTGQFNKNILKAVNQIMKADFNPDLFHHLALWNSVQSRVEMHLVAKENHEVTLLDRTHKIHFRKGEGIHTENSHKYSIEAIRNMARKSGMKVNKIHTDPNQWFALVQMSLKTV